MAYRELPSSAAGPPAQAALREFLLDLGARKEFRSLRSAPAGDTGDTASTVGVPAYGFAPAEESLLPGLGGLRVHGAQLFVRGFGSPDTPYPRLLINWQTGAGKTIGAIGVAQEYVRQFRARVATAPAERPTVFIIGFTRSIIQAEMLRRPEFGFVSADEVLELGRLRVLAEASAGPTSPESRQYAGFVGGLKRRITDRSRGGYYQFYGYKEFGNRLFAVTRRGEARGFSIQSLYARRGARDDGGADGDDEEGPEEAGLGADEPSFLERIDAAVAAGDVEVNRDLLADLRGGLIVADEVHNTYNVQTKNNYGVAIQYALDKLEEEDPRTAPRAVFMSATVTSGSATEIVDLLNFLIPLADLPGRRRLRREDFFRVEEGGGGVTPRPGALDQIGRLSAGRVSFLLDAGDPGESGTGYPRRIFEGDALPDPANPGADIAYLRFTSCPMSPFHARTLAHMLAQKTPAAPPASRQVATIPANAYTLYDMAYPNPEFPPDAAGDPLGDSYGLYHSAETPSRLAGAPAEWRTAAGVTVESSKGGEIRSGVPVLISGPFLSAAPADAPTGIAAYSTKYQRLVADALAFVRGGPGKIMIYHHRVRMSGVLQIQELLRVNGFADETAAPTPDIVCAVCGTALRDHPPAGGRPAAGASPHDYAPARFVIVNSELDQAAIDRSIARYNAPSNVEGYEYRVLVGSKKVREGYDFKAVRFQQIVSLPTDIPTFIQVVGRAVRKGSHAGLPADQRDVRIRVYVSTAREPGGDAPEVRRYAAKMRSYFVTQEVEKAVRTYAVDAFLNYEKLKRLSIFERPNLDAIPYRPAVTLEDVEGLPETTATFEAYGHGDREVALLTASIRALFSVRPVWTYEDLWKAVQTPGAVRGLAVDPASFSEESFAVALGALGRHSPSVVNLAGAVAGDPRDAGLVSRVGRFYLWTPAGPSGQPVLDVESYVRENAALGSVRLKVADYVKEEKTTHNFGVRLAEFETRFADPEAVIEDAFADYDADFHYDLLKSIVEAWARGDGPVHDRLRVAGGALARAAGLYSRFRVLVCGRDFEGRPEAETLLRSRRDDPETPLGYVSDTSVRLYDPPQAAAGRGGGRWYDIPRKALGVGGRYCENDIVVGYVERRGPHLRFKIRPPIHTLSTADVRDVRSLSRGAVCETRTRDEQEDLASRLKALRRAEAKELSSSEVCGAIRARLLALEEASRGAPDGMMEGLRHFYLFNDKLPTVTLSR